MLHKDYDRRGSVARKKGKKTSVVNLKGLGIKTK
jgi:hypothetical protein